MKHATIYTGPPTAVIASAVVLIATILVIRWALWFFGSDAPLRRRRKVRHRRYRFEDGRNEPKVDP